MPVGGSSSYFLRGHKPEADGDTLEEALARLQADWLGTRVLSPHDIGNLVITLRIGSEEVTLEITNPEVLDDFLEYGPSAILDEIAKQIGFSGALNEEILNRTAGRVEVDTFRDPAARDAWRPGEGVHDGLVYGAPSVKEAIPPAMPRMLGELLREEDKDRRRQRGRRRSKLASNLLDAIVERTRKKGWSDARTAKEYGLPRTTVRDVRYRQERKARIRTVLGKRPAGKPLTQTQRSLVLQEIKRQKGNASAAARALGLPPRTVREIRQRAAYAVGPRVSRASITAGRHATSTRAQVLAGVRGGLTATEAGREAGVAGRTARGWVRAERLKSPE